MIASAAANAQNNGGLDPATLVVATVYADQGPTAKRIRPRAQGRAFRIRRRTSHITVVVESRPAKDQRSAKSSRARRTEGQQGRQQGRGYGAGQESGRQSARQEGTRQFRR